MWNNFEDKNNYFIIVPRRYKHNILMMKKIYL